MEIEKCPFCGCDAIVIEHTLLGENYKTFYTIRCTDNYDCKAILLKEFSSEEKAIDAWNSRTN